MSKNIYCYAIDMKVCLEITGVCGGEIGKVKVDITVM